MRCQKPRPLAEVAEHQRRHHHDAKRQPERAAVHHPKARVDDLGPGDTQDDPAQSAEAAAVMVKEKVQTVVGIYRPQDLGMATEPIKMPAVSGTTKTCKRGETRVRASVVL